MREQSIKYSYIFIWGGLFLVIALLVSAYISSRGLKISPQEQQQARSSRSSVVFQNAPAQVNSIDNLPEVVEFGDFQCPSCKQMAPILQKLVEEEKINLIWIHAVNTGHEQSLPAALASQCAHQQNRFWEFHDLLFENQTDLSTALYLEIAKSLNFNIPTFQKCLDAPETRNLMQQNAVFTQENNVTSTPSLIIDNFLLEGLVTEEQILSQFNL
jgi:protein-disulfide isomerase